MKKGLLNGYTKGDDGLFRRLATMPDGRVIIVRDSRGRLVRTEEVRAGQFLTVLPQCAE